MIKKIIFILTALTALSLSAQTLDDHYIQNDDYFISDKALEGHSWIGIEVAKMIEAPGPETNGEAKFLVVRDGKEKWTKHYWQSRIAQKDEIKLGLPVIMFDYSSGGIYIPPKDRKIARTRKWFMAKVTDISTAYKGYVMVSGGYNVGINSIRVIGQGGVKTVEVSKNAPAAPSAPQVQKQIVQPEDSFVAAPSQKGGLRIVKAVYGGFLPENSVDVTDYLNTQIRNGKLTVKANDQFLKVRTNSSEERSLKIKYQTADGVFETVVIQGMETSIPNASHRKAQ